MPHEEISRELAQCHISGELVAYHMWGDEPGSFLVGRVQRLSLTSVTFQGVGTDGEDEPLPHNVSLRLVHSLDRGTNYLHRLQILRKLGPLEASDEWDARRPAEVRTILEEAAREEWIVRIWTAANQANDYLVSSVGEKAVNLRNVVDGGAPDGRSVALLKRIVRVRVGPSERNDARVHRHRKENSPSLLGESLSKA